MCCWNQNPVLWAVSRVSRAVWSWVLETLFEGPSKEKDTTSHTEVNGRQPPPPAPSPSPPTSNPSNNPFLVRLQSTFCLLTLLRLHLSFKQKQIQAHPKFSSHKNRASAPTLSWAATTRQKEEIFSQLEVQWHTELPYSVRKATIHCVACSEMYRGVLLPLAHQPCGRDSQESQTKGLLSRTVPKDK